MKRNYLVGYDVADPKRLRKVAKVVGGFGSRVQYSFFHCFLSEGQKKRMMGLLKEVIREGEDQVMILPVAEKQLREIEFVGVRIDLEAEGIIIV